MEKGEVILYQPNETIKLEVRLEAESVWLTQAQMAELFQTTPQNITIHVKSIYRERELEIEATCKEHLQVRKEGNRMVQRKHKFYNLDVIISVGYNPAPLTCKGRHVHVIGDADKVGNLRTVIWGAWKVAMKL